jgi:acyl carrier protein
VSTKDQVIEIVCDRLGTTADKLTDETSFTKDLGADSLDLVELVMAFEDTFGMSIPDEETQKIQTIGDTIKYIDEHTS